MGHHMIMGRKTWEAFPKALPGRISIVLGRNLSNLPEGVFAIEKLEDGSVLCTRTEEPDFAENYIAWVNEANKVLF